MSAEFGAKPCRVTDGEKYLQDYPRLNKWINQCGCCQLKGWKPGMPTDSPNTFAFRNLRSFFQELILDELNICEDCQRRLP